MLADTFIVNPSNMNRFSKNDPPYDKNGNGIPVIGINASTPAKLIIMCTNIYENVPNAMIESCRLVALRAITSIWNNSNKYASNTAIDGFEATDAPIMIVHSADDNVIGIEYGLDKYYKKYKNDPRFTFLRFEDRGHNDIFNDQANTYADEFNAEFDKWIETLDYDYKSEKNKERFMYDKADYINKHLDHARWSNRLDMDMFSQFLSFYDKAIQ